MTKIKTLLTLWDNRPRRVINFDSPDDRLFLNSIMVALKSAAPEIHDDGPLPDPDGAWFLTYTGFKFYPTNPNPEDVCIEDIAHHLSHLGRFNGATRAFYSIAQHCVMVANLLPTELKLIGLMHDGTEAYCNDMVRPLKYAMPRYLAIEDLIWSAAIAPRFNLPITSPTDIPEVKLADNIALMTERRDLLVQTDHKWSIDLQGIKPCNVKIVPMSPEAAEQAFLEMFYALTSLSRDPVVVDAPSSAVQSTPTVVPSIHSPTVTLTTAGIVASSDHKSDTSSKPASSSAKPAAARRRNVRHSTPSRRPSRLPAARSLAAPPPEPQPAIPETSQS